MEFTTKSEGSKQHEYAMICYIPDQPVYSKQHHFSHKNSFMHDNMHCTIGPELLTPHIPYTT